MTGFNGFLALALSIGSLTAFGQSIWTDKSLIVGVEMKKSLQLSKYRDPKIKDAWIESSPGYIVVQVRKVDRKLHRSCYRSNARNSYLLTVDESKREQLVPMLLSAMFHREKVRLQISEYSCSESNTWAEVEGVSFGKVEP
ncbi:hypothetical protein [Pseudobacteriovorax antillogorgiicola]|uniref:Uncharacterized protein n=1 Tax=Pseudobacteriovorax antillogorgiicola TaxID=1513793 RepID=A0A1Y6C2I9_9BACT|nr:hypothetical protein [Pseudobacteriovorax antillogorgiicola]TCS50667.1 hypothetical protein EDD56_11249 [Pseudobacteriovorax antillogorgiicola]SMF39953.1 hypothetical protein SAMN06296036_11248 [Pseudobacteriovorax antillogorgiicola]